MSCPDCLLTTRVGLFLQQLKAGIKPPYLKHKFKNLAVRFILQLRLFTRRQYLCLLRAWVSSEGKEVIPNAELRHLKIMWKNRTSFSVMQILLLIHSAEGTFDKLGLPPDLLPACVGTS